MRTRMICDAHIHVGRYYRLANPETFERGDFYYEPKIVAEVLKRCGVDEFIFSSISCQRHVTIAEVEREARETQAEFGPGAHPFFWVTGPFYNDDPDFNILDNGLFEGVKIHELETPWVKERPKDLDRILSILEERDVPVQIHSGEDTGCFPHELLPFAKRHPKLRIDFAHCRPCKEMIECLKECPNLFTDTAFMPPEYYSELVAAGVESKVLFGTDLPIQGGFDDWTDDDVIRALEHFYRKELSAVRAAGYSEAVMSRNFKRYLSKRRFRCRPFEVQVKQQGGVMGSKNDDELDEVLKSNPFKPKLIKQWKSDLQSFLTGKTRLSDLNFALDSDTNSIEEYQEKNKTNERKRLHLELLPQPFQGNPRAPIWLLMLNPSYSCVDRYDHLGLCPSCDKNLVKQSAKLKHDMFDNGKDKYKALQKRQSLLLQQLRLKKNYQFSILNNAFNTLRHAQEWQGAGGYRWWRNVLFGSNIKETFLLPECNIERVDASLVGRKLFVLECCPYHTLDFDSKLFEFGGEYAEFWKKLIYWAIKTKKIFIVRGKRIDEFLKNGKLSIDFNVRLDFSSCRKVALTSDNLKGQESVISQIKEILKRRT